MGCNCKTNRDISYLQKHYGTKVERDNAEDVKFTIGEFFRRLITYIVLLLSLPLMVVFLIIKLFSKKKEIDIGKLFRIKAV